MDIMEEYVGIVVAFITGVIGPIAVLYIKKKLEKKEKKDMVMEKLRVSELVKKKIEKIKGTADGYYEEFEIITQNNTAFNQEIFNTAKKQSKKI